MVELKPIKMMIIYGYISVFILLLIGVFWYILRGEAYVIFFSIVFFALSPMRQMVLSSFASIYYDENNIRIRAFRNKITIVLDQNIMSYSLSYTKRKRVEMVKLNGIDKYYKFNVMIYKSVEIGQLIDFIGTKYPLEKEY